MIDSYIMNYCSFNIFQEVNLQTFVMVKCKSIYRTMHKKLYSGHWSLKIKYFHFFPIVKINANYTEICRVGNLEADFQQFPLFKFSKSFLILL